MTDRSDYWNTIYATKPDNSVSWFEEAPALSLRLIEQATDARGPVIDVGGGASRLPEALLDLGFADVACLDLSAEGQRIARGRLGERGNRVRWIVANVVRWIPDRRYDVWHDRAAFHFLIEPTEQARYAATLDEALAPGGVAVIGTFAPDGPEHCSGLPVVRHDGASLAAILGDGFALLSEERHAHRTPAGSIQKFQFSTFRRN
ncbi:class I SAM-dependent methyltransferase [Sphingopyxis sp. R3-92]|uniref:class I SAM-dependent methyltransferase n=1 Tax=Sphingopyxis sp. R3-92 TaxID=3158553 RepID=UPI003EE74366